MGELVKMGICMAGKKVESGSGRRWVRQREHEFGVFVPFYRAPS